MQISISNAIGGGGGAKGGGGTPSFSNVDSFSFDGVDERFIGTSTYSELDGQSKATFSFWIKPTNLTPRYSFVLHIPRNTTATNGQITIFLDNNNRIRWSMDTASYYIFSNNNAITLGQWNHVLICVDLSITDEGRIFIDGVDQTALDNLNTRNFFSTSSGGLMIGENTYGYLNPFLGNIDEVVIWSGTDLRNDVATIYNNGEPTDLNNNGLTAPTTWSRMGDNATWNGATHLNPYWTMTDVNGGYISNSVNMAEANRTTDVPTLPFSTKSIALDGVDDYVDVADNSNLSFGNGVTDSPFSISTWVKMDDATKFRAIGKYGASNVEYLLGTGGSDTLVFNLYDNSTGGRIGRQYSTAITSFEGQWIHLAATYNGNSSTSGLKIYLNGSRVDNTNSTFGTYVAMENTTQPLYIGKLTTTYANGNVDETAIFNSELSASDVSTIYNSGVPNDLASLSPVSWWRCGDGDTAPTLTDNGSGRNDGTMTNFTTFSTDVPT